MRRFHSKPCKKLLCVLPDLKAHNPADSLYKLHTSSLCRIQYETSAGIYVSGNSRCCCSLPRVTRVSTLQLCQPRHAIHLIKLGSCGPQRSFGLIACESLQFTVRRTSMYSAVSAEGLPASVRAPCGCPLPTAARRKSASAGLSSTATRPSSRVRLLQHRTTLEWGLWNSSSQ
jgi:hypothetical protein